MNAPLCAPSRLDERRPSAGVALVVLALLGWTLLGASSALATRLALIPVAGERVTLDDAPRLEALDKTLRQAAAAIDGYDVQPRRQTSAHLAAARELGLNCALDDGACAAKLAVLAEVDEIVFPVARLADGKVYLRLLLFSSAGAEQVAQVEATVPASAAGKDMLQALLTSLLNDRPAPPPAPPSSAAAPAQSTPEPPPVAPTPAQAPDDPPLDDDAPAAAPARATDNDEEAAAAAEEFQHDDSIVGPVVMGLGVVVLGGGVVLTSAALASAGVIELLLNTPRAPDERALLQVGGQALLVVSGMGLLVVGLGGAVATAGLFIE